MKIYLKILIFLFFTNLNISAQNSDFEKQAINIAWQTTDSWHKSDTIILKKHIKTGIYFDGFKVAFYDDGILVTSYMEPFMLDGGFFEKRQVGKWEKENDLLSTSLKIVRNRSKFKILKVTKENLVLLML